MAYFNSGGNAGYAAGIRDGAAPLSGSGWRRAGVAMVPVGVASVGLARVWPHLSGLRPEIDETAYQRGTMAGGRWRFSVGDRVTASVFVVHLLASCRSGSSRSGTRNGWKPLLFVMAPGAQWDACFSGRSRTGSGCDLLLRSRRAGHSRCSRVRLTSGGFTGCGGVDARGRLHRSAASA